MIIKLRMPLNTEMFFSILFIIFNFVQRVWLTHLKACCKKADGLGDILKFTCLKEWKFADVLKVTVRTCHKQ